MSAPKLITTDLGALWILSTKEDGETVVSIYLEYLAKRTSCCYYNVIIVLG